MRIIKVENLSEWSRKITNEFKDYRRYISHEFYEQERKNKIRDRLGVDVFILLAVDDSNKVLGMSILNKNKGEIYAFYVKYEYREKGIGTELMNKSLELLYDNYPTIIVPDSNSHELYIFMNFLMKFNFKLGDITSYNNKCELVFNRSLNESILLSIKPMYSHNVFYGTKKVEFRKKPIPENKKVVVYSSSPVKSISGYFTIKEIDCDTPENLWKKYRLVGGICEKDFFDYYSGKDKGYAIVIDKVYPLESESILYGIGIKNLMRNFTAPQFYRYL